MSFLVMSCANIIIDHATANLTPVQSNDIHLEAKRTAFTSLIDTSINAQIDALIIAGDLFNFVTIQWPSIDFLTEQLKRLGKIPVFITPGERDPYTIGSPYETAQWPENVHIFRSETFTAVKVAGHEMIVWGAACKNLLVTPSELQIPDLDCYPDDTQHILCFSGHAIDLGQSAKSFPIEIEQFCHPRISALAIGTAPEHRSHLHYDNLCPCPSPCFVTLEDTDSGYASLSTITKDGIISQKRQPTSNAIPLRISLDVCHHDSFQSILNAIDAAIKSHKFDDQSASTTGFIVLELYGRLKPEVVFCPDSVDKRLQSFAFARVENNLSPFLNWQHHECSLNLKGAFISAAKERLGSNCSEKDLERTIYYGLFALMKDRELLKLCE